jgi:excisionase family DNA binding protein
MTTVKEAATRLGVSELLVRRAVKTGEIPSTRLGSRVLIPRTAVDRLVDGTNGHSANQS